MLLSIPSLLENEEPDYGLEALMWLDKASRYEHVRALYLSGVMRLFGGVPGWFVKGEGGNMELFLVSC